MEQIAVFPELKEAKAKIKHLQSEVRWCRNELCLKCGNYKRAHEGACNDCRFRHSGEYAADLDEQERIAIMSESGWHDAEKDQPKETDCYIVRIDYGVGQMTTMREYISSEGKWLKSIEEKITHWMPLPKPPKEGEQE